MDRQIVYPGSIPLDTDLLQIQRHTLVALGSLAQCVLGGSPLVDGFACSPSSEGYRVIVGPGSLSVQVETDGAAYGSLPPDPTATVKVGVSRGYTELQLGSWPDQGSVLCWLIQVSLLEQDGGPVALPYWNAADPSIPFSGPANSGFAQNTQRSVRALLSAKSSGPLPQGTYAPPPPDAGHVGLFGVVTWSGKAGINAEDIRPILDAPFLPFQLPQLTPGFSRQEAFGGNTAWQVPRGVRRVRVRLVGAGGGGGGGSMEFGGGGGGAGGYAESIFVVQPGQYHSVVVGAGGGAAAPGTTAGTGGPSQFAEFVSASGGAGGGSANPDSHGGGGGNGVAGGLLQPGGCGGDGPMIGGVPAGNGGASAFGGGGRGANFGGSPADGKAAGSGAGGGYGANASGGIGARGLVIVEY